MATFIRILGSRISTWEIENLRRQKTMLAAFSVMLAMNGGALLNFGEAGQGPGEFWIPTSIFIDRANRIFVSDSYNQRVQVFKFLGEQ